jgi:glucose/arabinose dehydrogenase
MKRLSLFLFLSLCLSSCALIDLPTPTGLPAPTATLEPMQVSTPTPAFADTPTAVPNPTDTPIPPDTETPSLDATLTAVFATLGTPTPILLPFPPDPNAYALRRIVSGLERPVYLTHAGDTTGRLFVVEQSGRIRILQNGALLADPFLDLTDLVNDSGNEQGLLGLAFHPDYAANGLFFVNYTDANGDTAVVRYSVSADPNRADPASAKMILQVAQPFPNHNGGDLAFGPDGYLYIGLGDGGSAGDPQGNGQNLKALLGKLLRIDVNPGDPYGIPPDNPFVGHPEARPEIWAYGLRNPWRYSFDRATGDLYIADVGQNAYEEIDYQPAGSQGGENYGWNFMEGAHPFKGQAPAGLTAPVAEYSHQVGGCSVTGGYVYRGPSLPALNGVYLYGDYCSGQVWALYRSGSSWENVALLNAFFTISSFGEDANGEVYVLDHGGGAVYQWVAAP